MVYYRKSLEEIFMIYDRQLSEVSYIHKKVSDISNASRFPFFVKSAGFLSDCSISFESDGDSSDIVLLYSLSGTAYTSQNNEIKYLRGSDAAVVSCSDVVEFNKSADEKWEYLFVVFNGQYAKNIYDMICEKGNIHAVTPPALMIRPLVQLLQIDYDDSDLSALKASALLHNIISVVYDSSQRSSSGKQVFPDQYLLQVNAAINYIRNNYDKECSVDNVCAHVGFSKYHFCRIFKDITGVTMHRFVNRHRVTMAAELLSGTELSVFDIGSAVGFNDIETFTRVFKSIMGMSPSTYRKNA